MHVFMRPFTKSLWIAWGYYIGDEIRATGSSEEAALMQWRQRAAPSSRRQVPLKHKSIRSTQRDRL